jgi:hypothetical protein
MPSHHTPPSGVSATLVKMVLRASVAMALGLVLPTGAGRDAEEAGFGIDGAQRPLASGLIQAMSSPTVQTFQPFETGGRNQHGEVGLAAGAGKRGGDVGLFALRILHAEDQHVLGHPAFVARDVGGDAQREALLAQQRVAAVAGAVGPDLARLGKMDDVLGFVAGPRHVLLPGASGAPTCACRAPRASRPYRSRETPAGRCAP